MQARDARLPNESSYPKNPEVTENAAPETQPTENVTPYDLVAPPQSWKKDMHPVWQQLPAQAREYINERELQMTQRLSEFGRMTNEASEAASRLGINEMTDVLQRHAEVIPRLPDGQAMPPHEVLNSLLSAHQWLLRDPENAIKWLAQDRGVDLARLAESPSRSNRADASPGSPADRAGPPGRAASHTCTVAAAGAATASGIRATAN